MNVIKHCCEENHETAYSFLLSSNYEHECTYNNFYLNLEMNETNGKIIVESNIQYWVIILTKISFTVHISKAGLPSIRNEVPIHSRDAIHPCPPISAYLKTDTRLGSPLLADTFWTLILKMQL